MDGGMTMMSQKTSEMKALASCTNIVVHIMSQQYLRWRRRRVGTTPQAADEGDRCKRTR